HVIRSRLALEQVFRHQVDSLFSLELPERWEVVANNNGKEGSYLIRELDEERMYRAKSDRNPSLSLDRFIPEPGRTAEEIVLQAEIPRHCALSEPIANLPCAAARFGGGTLAGLVAVWRTETNAYRLWAQTPAESFARWEECLLRIVRSVRLEERQTVEEPS